MLSRLTAKPARLAFAAIAMVLLAVGVWTIIWWRATVTAQTAIENWRSAEARRGNSYRCASLSISGYPFRIEVRCTGVEAELASAHPAALIRTPAVTVVAQIYDPSLFIGEITGPLTLADPDRPGTTFSADWDLAQTSARIDAVTFKRISVVFDGLRIVRAGNAAPDPVAQIDRLEWHVRPSPRASADQVDLDVAVRLAGATAAGVADWARTPFDADIVASLRDIGSLRPKSLPALLRDVQAAGGRVEITQARLAQGETQAMGSGVLSLTPRGRLDGTMQLTVAGLERLMTSQGALSKFADVLGANKVAPPDRINELKPALGTLNRLLPSLGIGRREAEAGAAASLALIGRPTQLEGRPATALTLRFGDGAVSLGPISLGEVAPLF